MTRALIVSGHLIDMPDRRPPRFPQSVAGRVAAEMDAVFGEWGIGPGTTVVCGGARGADLIGAELALRRGARVVVCLALPPEDFVRESVDMPGPAGAEWRERFAAVTARAQVLPPPDAHARPNAEWGAGAHSTAAPDAQAGARSTAAPDVQAEALQGAGVHAEADADAGAAPGAGVHTEVDAQAGSGTGARVGAEVDARVFARANARMVETARALDPGPRAVVVWDGRAGDGPGGTGDLVARLGYDPADPRLRVIDPTTLRP
ncbi:hypothetical protein HTZ77_13305 [Nonomuraea sp. SMC257]|uniref:Uncharacterized protein n=1 Tax=Nonomuraea montanisoli TaxID=2741721 RepID=A0A7Y6I654_9ACTN|nr:hypothetical protein [Nonomuraea montanisoli]NUW32400.1 hypothetical protein [Nonomuraea montanisoli]